VIWLRERKASLCSGFVVVYERPWKALAYRRITVTLSLSDEDFGKLVSGKTQAQRLFMSGKLKIKGDVMKVSLQILFIVFLITLYAI